MASIPPRFQGSTASQPANSSSLHHSVQKALRSPGIHQVLEGLGLKPENLSKVIMSQGRFESPMKGIEHMSMLNIQPDHAQLLASLGLGGIESALVIQAESDIKKMLKTAFKELKQSLLNHQDILTILQALSITSDASTLVFSDDQGGLVLLQSAIRDIESQLED